MKTKIANKILTLSFIAKNKGSSFINPLDEIIQNLDIQYKKIGLKNHNNIGEEKADEFIEFSA